METKRPAWLDLLNATAVPFVLASLGALLLVAHQREQVSQVENRRLASWPKVSWVGLRDGSYTRDIENYIADHFPFRERFVAAAFALRERRGLRPDTRVYDEGVGGLEDSEQWAKGVEKDGGAGDGGAELAVGEADAGLDVFVAEAEAGVGDGGVEGEDGGAPENGVAEAESDAGVDLEAVELPDEAFDAGPTSIHAGVLVHGGRGMMLFNGTDESAQVFARIINGYAAAFPRQTMYVVVTPTATPFYIPEEARSRTASERDNLEVLKAALAPKVKFADVYSALAPHAGESIFYKTDHHWTALGAYYGYSAFCSAAGIRPVAVETMEKRSRPPTQGSLYRLTRDAALKDVTDPTDYFATTVPWKAVRFTGPEMKTPVRAKVIDDEGTGYLSFLGGDWGVMLVRTEATTGRRAMVVKNSFGNVFTPFLLPHYEALVVVDYRYTERSLAELVRLYRIDDIIVVVDTVTANFPMHQRRLREVVTGHEAAWREGRGPLPDGGVRVKL